MNQLIATARVALRLSHRRLLRQRAGSGLLVLLAFLPLIALDVGTIALASSDQNPVAAAQAAVWGAAEARLTSVSDTPVSQDGTGAWRAEDTEPAAGGDQGGGSADLATSVRRALPEGSELIPTRGFIATLTAGDRATEPVAAEETELGAEVSKIGYLPTGPGEVSLGLEVAQRLGVSKGDTVRVAVGDQTVDAVVVGVWELRNGVAVVTWPGDLDLLSARTLESGWFVVGSRVGWPSAAQLNKLGVVAVSPLMAGTKPPEGNPFFQSAANAGDLLADPGVFGVAAGVAALLASILVVGPAFSIVMQRSRREIALVGASGAPPWVLGLVVLSYGFVIGAIATTLALSLGLLVAHTAFAAGRLQGAAFFVVPVPALLLTWALGAGVATVAAGLAARSVARLNLAEALFGEVDSGQAPREVRHARLGVAMAGLVLLALGVAVANLIVTGAGIVVTLLGVALGSGAAFQLLAARIGPLGFAVRLAIRSSMRQPRRTTASVTVIAIAVTVALGGVLVAQAADAAGRHRYIAALPHGASTVSYLPAIGAPQADVEGQWDELRTYMQAHLGPGSVHEVGALDTSTGDTYLPSPISVGAPDGAQLYFDPEAIQLLAPEDAAILAVDDAAAAADALAAGELVVTDPSLVGSDGTVAVRVIAADGSPGTSIRLPAFVAEASAGTSVIAATRQVAVELGLGVRRAAMVYLPNQPPTGVVEDELRAYALGIFGPRGSVLVYTERGYRAGSEISGAQAAAWAASVLAVLLAWATTALSAREQRAELRRLESMGLSPAGRRRLAAALGGSASVAAVLLGSVAGIAVGASTVAAQWRGDHAWSLAVPWATLAMLWVLVPALSIASGVLSTRASVDDLARRD